MPYFHLCIYTKLKIFNYYIKYKKNSLTFKKKETENTYIAMYKYLPTRM